jgi:O-6-methylguanine DNA methyltransferase
MANSLSDNQEPIAIDTDYGVFVALITKNGISRIYFPNKLKSIGLNNPTNQPKQMDHNLIQQVREVINCILTGKPQKINLPIDISEATNFQKSVWEYIKMIPCGYITTYATIAKAIGQPQASRAVANACAANPVPLLIPCHRVIRSDGTLGGYSSGLKWKHLLLKTEKIPIARLRNKEIFIRFHFELSKT